jgi:hypothetical protein
MDVSFVDDVGCLMVTFNVATESQPAALVNVFVYVPLVVYVTPFHTYDPHTGAGEVVDVVDFLIVKFNVATESHPTAFPLVNVFVYVPLDVYVTPFHTYESQTDAVDKDAVG